MNTQQLFSTGAVIFAILLLVSPIHAQVCPWTAYPNWVSEEDHFTMSVALVDVDNDEDLDFVAGNYKYPYSEFSPGNPGSLGIEEIGDNVIAYRWNSSTNDFVPEDMTNLHCVDCIAFADYDEDGDMDLVMGMVVGKGGDGGVRLLENNCPPGQPWTGSLMQLFGNDQPVFQSSSYDAHCVRWVDFDADGDLDLAALDIPGILHLYTNDPVQGGFSSSRDYTFHIFPETEMGIKNKTCYNPSLTRDFEDLPVDDRIRGTTIEFGDMDNDGLPDLYINDSGILKVYRNLYDGNPQNTYQFNTAEGYWPVHREPNDPPLATEPFCASFGRYNIGATEYLALAVGNMSHCGKTTGTEPYRSKWGNDIFILQDGELYHTGRSDIVSSPAQPVTDIQWAQINNDANNSNDVVAVAYPVYYKREPNNPDIWDRGYEQVHLDPGIGCPPGFLHTDIWTATAGNNDLSTSLALGDISGTHWTTTTETITGIEDRLLYMDHYPFIELQEVAFYNGDIRVSEWVPGCSTNPFNVAYDPVNGWVSIESGYEPDANRIMVTYTWSTQYDLAVGNDGRNVVYYHVGGNLLPNDPNPPNLDCTPPAGTAVKTYAEPAGYSAAHLDLMAKDPVGFEIGEDAYSVDHLPDRLEQLPSMRRIGLINDWDRTEIFKGHYFWHWMDTSYNYIYELRDANHDYKCYFRPCHSPLWTIGNFNPEATDTHKRNSDERLFALFMRNVVNRYRPGGVLNSPLSSYQWNNWGVDIFGTDYETNWEGRDGYGDFPDAIHDTALRMFYNYQMIKTINPNLKVLSPQSSPYTPVSTENYPDNNLKYIGPPMPYLNKLNAVNLNLNVDNNVLWNYCDYIFPGMTSQIGLFNQEAFRDPFNSEVVVVNSHALKIAFESAIWGFYTEGLEDYYDPDHSVPIEHENWSPVMKGPNETYSEHPFFLGDFCFFEENSSVNPEAYPQADWITSMIAESFSVDAFPLDDEKDHYLAESCNSWVVNFPYGLEPGETCAKVLNDNTPTGPGKMFSFASHFIPNPSLNNVKVHQYVFQPRLGTFFDKVHFIRTDYCPPNQADRYVKVPWECELHSQPNPACYEVALDNTKKLDCYTPSGNLFQKEYSSCNNCHTQAPTQKPHKTSFAEGEMGPGMLIMAENNAASTSNYSQSLQLHEGWNLVSWHIKVRDLSSPPGDLLIDEVVAGVPNDPVNLSIADQFGTQHPLNRIFDWDSRTEWYPQNLLTIPWDRKLAYYIYFDHPLNWSKADASFDQYEIIHLQPNSAWSDSIPGPDNQMMRWVFLGYPTIGYMKLASIPNSSYVGMGNPAHFDYEGPFHWLIWNHDDPNQYQAWDLKIVRTDDGRYYIPRATSSPTEIDPIDQIQVLEPGKGYFLGFYCGPGRTYDFDSWMPNPVWINNSIEPTPSVSHFQFKSNTHWCYPVIIDTVDLTQTPLEIGDEIAVYDGDLCVGAVTFNGSFPVILNSWKDDLATTDLLDGYIANDPMTFRWFDVSENAEAEFLAEPGIMSVEDDPVTPTHSGFGCGAYAMRSFSYGSQTTLQLPMEFRIGQNFPNPFNAETVIPLELPQRSHVKIELFNVRGQNLGVIFEGVENAGWPKISYNASALSSGIYFCRVTAEGLERNGKYQGVSKIVLLK
jgi:hypothetical protein